MAGKRRSTGKPMRRVASCNRRKQNVEAELAAATDPADRIGIAADYLRAALRRRGPGRSGRVDELVDDLKALGDRINETVKEGTTRDRT